MLEKFYQWLQLNKNSQKTIKSYFQQVNRFGKFYNYNFNQDNLNKYIIKMIDENKAQSSINLFLIAIRAYTKFSKIELDIPVPKKVKRKGIKFYFTEKTIKNVYKILPKFNGDYKLKDLILKFMFYTGVRPSELVNLQVKDIDFDEKIIKIYNAKGNKDRVIPFINNELYNTLKSHCNSREGKVFDFTYDQLLYLFKQIKEELNLDEMIEPRTLRRSFARYCASKGMDSLYLKILMGHEDIKVTEGYVEVDGNMLKDLCEELRDGKLRLTLAEALAENKELKKEIKKLKKDKNE